MRTTTRPDSDSRPTRERSRLDDVAPRRRPPLPAAEPHRDARRATAARHGVVALVVLIPAYQPDMRLTRLVRDVRRALPETRVLVVDDGSGPAYEGVLAAACGRAPTSCAPTPTASTRPPTSPRWPAESTRPVA